MSFLRSIIADTRPRKYTPGSNRNLQVNPRLEADGLNQGVSETKAKSPDLQSRTNHTSTSNPMQKSADNKIVADVSGVQESNPTRLDNHDNDGNKPENEEKNQNRISRQPTVQKSQASTSTPADIDQNTELSNTLAESQDVQYQPIYSPEAKPDKMTENFIDHDKPAKAVISSEIKVDEKPEAINEPHVTHKLKNVIIRNPVSDINKSLDQADKVLKDGTVDQLSSGIKNQAEPENLYPAVHNGPGQAPISQKDLEHQSNSNMKSVVKKAAITSGKLKPAVAKQDGPGLGLKFYDTPPTVDSKGFQSNSIYNHSGSSHISTGKEHEIPSVQIGQIDVIIEMPAKPVSKPAATPSTVDLASRYYLRRL